MNVQFSSVAARFPVVSDTPRAKVAFVYNTARHVERARKNLIRAIMGEGHDVVLISPYDSSVPRLVAMGITHEPIRMTQYGMNPFKELLALAGIRRALKIHRPFVCLNYTIKPNTLGNLAARSLGIPTISNIAGSGRAFSGGGEISKVFFRALLRASLRSSSRVFFQNDDDRDYFLGAGMVRPDAVGRLPGSGVDLEQFRYDAELPRAPTFLFIGRLLKEKGADLFLREAVGINSSGVRAEFRLAGERLEDPGYVSREDINTFQRTDGCQYLGVVSPDDVPKHIRQATFVVLPSLYGEGVPRSLLEACAIGRPIITTNSVGCKDVLIDGVNGFRVDPQFPFSLREVFLRAIDLDPVVARDMGRQARSLVEQKFDERIVLDAYLREISVAQKRSKTTPRRHRQKTSG